MISEHDNIGIGSFACAFGDAECKPEDIPALSALGFYQQVAVLDPGVAVHRRFAGCLVLHASYRDTLAPMWAR